MTKESNTTPAPFLKELDPEFHRFLRLVDRLESEMVRMDVAVADLKVYSFIVFLINHSKYAKLILHNKKRPS